MRVEVSIRQIYHFLVLRHSQGTSNAKAFVHAVCSNMGITECNHRVT